MAKSGVFSSDRTIREYNDLIWHLTPLTRSADVHTRAKARQLPSKEGLWTE